MKNKTFAFEFVDYIPDRLKDDVIYISTKYTTAVHNCACGCGREVVTPLSPVDWSLIFDGVSVSLSPSIGNWSFPCQSHYWIKNNQIKWAPKWSQEQIEIGRAQDKFLRDKYYANESPITKSNTNPKDSSSKGNFWQKIIRWFTSK